MERHVVKKIRHEPTYSVLYTFLGEYADENFNIDKPEHRELTLGWLSDQRIKRLVKRTDDIELLKADLMLEFRLVFENVIKRLKEKGTAEQVKEMISFIEDFIALSVLTYNIVE